MIIIGHKAIKYENFIHIKSIEDFSSVSGSDIAYFNDIEDMDFLLAKHADANKIDYAVVIDNILASLIYANLNAKYIIIQRAPEVYQKIFDNYLFDSKILYLIDSEDEIAPLAKIGVDGVIFEDILED